MEEIDVKQLMRERLPSYAVNCLLAAGYDSADVICSMNTSEEPDNSFAVIKGRKGGPFFVYTGSSSILPAFYIALSLLLGLY